MDKNLVKRSRFISLLLVLVTVFMLMTPGFAQTQEYKGEYIKENYREKDTFPLTQTTSGTALSAVSTPGALGYEFDAENKEITKYTGTETKIVIPSNFKVGEEIVPVESIGKKAFMSKKIEAITVSENIKDVKDFAFYSCKKLKEITIKEGLKEIGESAFSSTVIEAINIPGSVQTIGNYAFKNCTGLNKITFNEGLKEIKNGVFYGTSIEEIVIPSTIEKIGEQIFNKNKTIKKITVLNKKENINVAENAFPKEAEVIYLDEQEPGEEVKTPEGLGYKFDADNKEITKYIGLETEIAIPNEFTVGEETVPVESIGEGAFENNENAVKIIVPASIKTVKKSAFKNCTKLNKITLNEGLKEIDSEAFYGTSIEEIVIPSTIEKIGEQIFGNNKVLKKINILNKKENIDVAENAFPEEAEVIYPEEEAKTPEELGYEFNVENKEITKYTGTEKEIAIPSKFKVGEEIVPVESIGEGAFQNTNVVKVTVPRSIKTIGRFAFYMCRSLSEVTLNEGLERIGSSAFYFSAVKEINIPGSIQTIDTSTFALCTSLSKVTLNEGLKEIGDSAFNTTIILKINIPNSVQTIGKKAFSGCESLSEVTLNYGLKEISDYAFYKTAIKKIIIPDSVQTIGASAFNQCIDLSEVTLNEGLQIISTAAFRQTAIKEINVPGSVKTIGNSAFYGCTGLNEATLNEGLKEILKGAFSKTSIKEIVIPSTIETIGAQIFSGNNEIEKITVLNKKENIAIDLNAFPKSVKVVYKEKEEPGEEDNVIVDYVLKKIINLKLKKEDLNAPVTKEELAVIGDIKSSGLDEDELWKLEYLEGLQYATNLTSLDLNGVRVTDLEPIKGLPHLSELCINGSYQGDNQQFKGEKSPLKDITSVGEMEQLTILRIIGTQLKDIIPISNLKNLQQLDLMNNEISNISFLKDVPIASQLYLRGNCIGDFSPVKGKEAFNSVGLDGQRVTVVPEMTEFANPLINSDEEYIVLPGNENVVNTGDNNEILKILQMPAEGDDIKIEYGSTTDPSTLSVDVSKLNVIKDPILRKSINLYRNKKYKESRSANQAVLKEDLMVLSELDLDFITEDERKEIKDITGLENLLNATKLSLKGTSVENLDPIKNLTKLESIFLGGSYYDGKTPNSYLAYNNTKLRSPLKDVSPLAGLKNLKSIWINDSQVADISPLANLKKLNSVYLMRNKIENVECLKDVPIEYNLFLQGNCIGDFSFLKGKNSLKIYIGQNVNIIPDKVEFDNPLKDVEGKYIKLPENEYITNTGDKFERLKVLKIPTEGNVINIEYGSTDGGSTLSADISRIRGEFEDSTEKYLVRFNVLGMQGDNVTSTINDAQVQVCNGKGEELTSDNTVLNVWSLSDGNYTYKVSHIDYKSAEGKFDVNGKELTLEVSLTLIPKDDTDHDSGRPGSNHGGSSKPPVVEEPIKNPSVTEIPEGSKSSKKIKLQKSEIEILPNTFDQKVVLTAKEDGSVLDMKAVDEKGSIVEIKRPLLITMPYEGEVKNGDNVMVVLTDENGNEEAAGGVYDADTGTIKFLANKWGKFTVREGEKKFKDTSDVEWAKAAIESVSVKGIMKEKGNDMFAPSDYITRGEFAAVISGMLKLNESMVSDIPFDDVVKDKWYYDSVAAVYQNGFINGKSAASFDPEGNITRQEIAEIIGSLLKNSSYEKLEVSELTGFKDHDSIAQWAEGSVATAVNNGIIVGSDGNFMPDKNATRAETAVMVYRLYSLIMKQ